MNKCIQKETISEGYIPLQNAVLLYGRTRQWFWRRYSKGLLSYETQGANVYLCQAELEELGKPVKRYPRTECK